MISLHKNVTINGIEVITEQRVCEELGGSDNYKQSVLRMCVTDALGFWIEGEMLVRRIDDTWYSILISDGEVVAPVLEI
jgi:hypothetical protein